MVERQHSEVFAEIKPKKHLNRRNQLKYVEEEDTQEDEMRKYAALFKIKINQKNLDQLGDEINKTYEKDVVMKGKLGEEQE